MVLGKNIDIYCKEAGGLRGVSIIVEKRGCSDVLYFESGVAAALSTTEFYGFRHEYQNLHTVYTLLGVLPYQPTAMPNTKLLFLLAVTQCRSVGKLPYKAGECEIFRVNEVRAIPLGTHIADQSLVQEVVDLFTLDVFYFAVANGQNQLLDLTLSAQKLNRLDDRMKRSGEVPEVIKRSSSDNRFCWNRMLFVYPMRFGIDTDNWFSKIICGCVEIKTIYAGNGKQARACLISRSSTWRPGSRSGTRGVNDDGLVANFVETEQLLYSSGKVAGFIQIRGSVPLHWQQRTGAEIKSHHVSFSRPLECMRYAFDKHFDMLKREYGEVAVVNLLGTKEGEIVLTQSFEHHLLHSPRFRVTPYISFDFHSQCWNGHVENLSSLKAQLDIFLQTCGMFVWYNNTSSVDVAPISLQTGVVRSNGLDCLDRTNCTQAYLGLEILAQQMQAVGLDSARPQLLLSCKQILEQMWIVNGELISRFYTGTRPSEKSILGEASRLVTRNIQHNLFQVTKRVAMETMLKGDKRFHREIVERARTILPSGYGLLPVFMLTELVGNAVHFTRQQPLRIWCGTWNVNGGKYARSELYRDAHTLSTWLIQAPHISRANRTNYIVEEADFSNSPDVFAVGFEEIIDLNVASMMSASKENQHLWAEELRRILQVANVENPEHYVLVRAQQMAGVCLFVFVLPKHMPHMRELSSSQVKTGFDGNTENKGSVAIRFTLYNTSMCFVCSHLAAGQSKTAERNKDFHDILKHTSLRGPIESHDYVFWCGDLNYRIDMPRDSVKRFASNSNWARLLEADQLLLSQRNGQAFVGYEEAPICFAPTYKLDFNSDVYDTSEKCRIPAWTDRVLVRTRQTGSDTIRKLIGSGFRLLLSIGHQRNAEKLGATKFLNADDHQENAAAQGEDGLLHQWNHAQIVYYGRSELRTSDHRPVAAIIDALVRVVDPVAFRESKTRIMHELGPPDATVVVSTSSDAAGATMYDADIYNEVMALLSAIDQIIFIRYDLQGKCLVTFNNTKSALYAVQSYNEMRLQSCKTADVSFLVQLRMTDWTEWLDAIEHLCLYSSVPLVDAGTSSADTVWNVEPASLVHQPMFPKKPKPGHIPRFNNIDGSDGTWV